MSAPNWAHGTIWTGDCLDVMRGMNSETVDLIYLDPPFNSKADYSAPIGSQAAGAAFKDTWHLSDVDAEWINLIEDRHPAVHRVLLAAMTDSDKSYLAYMAARLLEMPRVLKSTGSLYLHCDPTMSHYLKALLDAIFGGGRLGTKSFGTTGWERSGPPSTIPASTTPSCSIPIPAPTHSTCSAALLRHKCSQSTPISMRMGSVT